MSLRSFPLIILATCALSACALSATSGTYRFNLTDRPLHPSELQLTDRRTPEGRAAAKLPGGQIVGDGALSPEPVAFAKSELLRLAENEKEFSSALDYLRTHQIALTVFTVAVTKQDLTSQTRTNAPPGTAAVDYLMRSLTQSVFADPRIALQIDILVDGQNFTSGVVTWTTKATPPENAAVFPASYAIRKVLEQVVATGLTKR